MKKNSNSDTGAFLVFAGIGAVLFAIAFFCDVDKLSKSLDKFWNYFCTSDDPILFVGMVVVAIIVAGLLMAIEYRPRK